MNITVVHEVDPSTVTSPDLLAGTTFACRGYSAERRGITLVGELSDHILLEFDLQVSFTTKIYALCPHHLSRLQCVLDDKNWKRIIRDGGILTYCEDCSSLADAVKISPIMDKNYLLNLLGEDFISDGSWGSTITLLRAVLSQTPCSVLENELRILQFADQCETLMRNWRMIQVNGRRKMP